MQLISFRDRTAQQRHLRVTAIETTNLYRYTNFYRLMSIGISPTPKAHVNKYKV